MQKPTMSIIPATTFQRNIGEYVDRAARGETVIVERHKRPAFAMMPIDEFEDLCAIRQLFRANEAASNAIEPEDMRLPDAGSRFAEPMFDAAATR